MAKNTEKKTIEDFYALADKYFYKNPLPNGAPTSYREFIKYVTQFLGHTFYYKGEGANFGKTLPYNDNGLRNRLMKYVKGKADVKINQANNNIEILSAFSNDEDFDFEFHDGDYSIIQPYKLLEGQNYSALVLSDIHIPYHDKQVLIEALKYGRNRKVNCIILNGDILDMHGASSKFVRIPSKKRVKDEIEDCKIFLAQLRKLFPTEKILFKIGNHEARFDNYIMTRCSELWEMDILNLKMALRLEDFNIDYVVSSQPIMAGKLMIAHGHEWGGGGGGINAARGMFLKANCNLLVGHYHRSQEFMYRNAHDETHGVWVQGCLCYLRPEYLPNNNWNHGFSVVDVQADGNFMVHNKKIINGKVC